MEPTKEKAGDGAAEYGAEAAAAEVGKVKANGRI